MSVVVMHYKNKWRDEISSSITPSNFASNLKKMQQKLTKCSDRRMESMLYQGHTFLGGIEHFWMAVRVWKANLVLEAHAHKKQMKM
jgi:hypothetical protein